MSFCPPLEKDYIGRNVYGNGVRRAEPCDTLTNVEQFNTYCQTPALSPEAIAACQKRFAEEANNPEIAYQRFLRLPFSEWKQNYIPSGGYLINGLAGAAIGITLSLRTGGDTLLYHVISLVAGTDISSVMLRATVGSTIFMPVPPVERSSNSSAFDVDAAGRIYFADVQNDNVEVLVLEPNSNTPQIAATIAALGFGTVGTLGVSPGGGFVAVMVGNKVVRVNLKTRETVDAIPNVINFPLTSRTFVNDEGTVCYYTRNVSVDFVDCRWFYNNNAVSSIPNLKMAFLPKHISSAGVLVGVTLPIGRLSQLEVVTAYGRQSTHVLPWSATAIDIDWQMASRALIIEDGTTTIWQFNYNAPSAITLLGNRQVEQSGQFIDVALNSQWFFCASSFANVGFFQLFDFDQGYGVLTRWANDKMDVRLCDSGDIITVSKGAITNATNTSDRISTLDTLFANLQCDVKLELNKRVVSKNGKYLAGLEPTFLQQNLANDRGLYEFCKDKITECTNSYGQYLANTPEDPRSFCFENSQGIVASLFNEDELQSVPSLYQQLKLNAPCIASTCQPYFAEETVMAQYLSRFNCSTDFTICTSVLSLSESGRINGNVTNSVSCGAGSNIPCGGTCPLGTKCDPSTNFCEMLCSNTNGCGYGQACSDGLCKTVSVPTGWTTAAIVVAAVLGALVVAFALWVSLKYTLLKNH